VPRPEIIPSPNIWLAPDVYELENHAVDPDGAIEAAMRTVRDWAGLDVLDVGCGTGFHLPRFAATSASVVGVEPHLPLLRRARVRVAALGLENVSVRRGRAQGLPVADRSVDVAHARWAYFFGPGCEPGLRELRRVLRRGGVAFVIDNDPTRSTFGGWFMRALPRWDVAGVERFWARQGFAGVPVEMRWSFARRADLEAVVGIEFAPELAAAILSEHEGLEVDYAVMLRWRRFP
jgi:SAM-dependent methyltransferase